MEAEPEARDDAEVAAATAERPEQIRVGVLVREQNVAAGRHDLRAEEVVEREAVAGDQVPDAAAEGQPADAGRSERPARGYEPVALTHGVEVDPGRAPTRLGDALHRVDAHVAEQAQVDHHSALADRVARDAVGAGPYGYREFARAGELDRCGDVGGVEGPHDHRRPAVDRPVVDGTREVVLAVLRPDQLPAQGRLEVEPVVE